MVITVLTTFLIPETFLENSANNGSENIILVLERADLISGNPCHTKWLKSEFLPTIGIAKP